jgi:hypothetical protein
MELNFNFNFVDLEGKEMQDNNAGKTLANALAYSQDGNAFKFWDWARKLFKGDKLNLDESDTQTLKSFIESNKSFVVISRAQLLHVFNKTK